MNSSAVSGSQFGADIYWISATVQRNQLARELNNPMMDDRTIDSIFLGSLESLPPVSSKIVRIFTSSTFTGVCSKKKMKKK